MKVSLFDIAGFAMKKALGAMAVMLGVSLIAFLLSVYAPGDPAYMILAADGNAEPSRQEVFEMRDALGLNDPIHRQYGRWLLRVLHGDMGRSFVNGKKISREMAMRLPYTLKLALFSTLVSTLLGVAMGMLMASGLNRPRDRVGQGLSLALISVPDFWLAILLIGIFSETWQLLPTSGVGSLKNYVLPSLVMAAASLGTTARFCRTLLLDELGRDYILTARSKGISEGRVLVGHALANTLIPLTTTLGLRFGHMLGGAVIIESIFAIPGIGQYAMNGIGNRDYPVIQGFVLYTGGLFVAVNFMLDMFYLMINPQLRVKGATR